MRWQHIALVCGLRTQEAEHLIALDLGMYNSTIMTSFV
jgi:hypothetical protein